MKKIFTTMTMALAVTSFTFAQDVIVKPKTVISINKVKETIKLDGEDLEAAWATATENKLERGDSMNAEGFKASFKALWDDDYIYMLISAVDQNPFEYDGTDSWKKDGVQIYFDVRDSLVVGKKVSERQHTLPFCYGMTDDNLDLGALFKDNTSATYAKIGSTSTGDGWAIEVRIPITTLYSGTVITDYAGCVAARKVKANDTIGFAIQANNYNADLATPDRTAVVTYPGGSDTWNNSSAWGGLKLIESSTAVSLTTASSFSIYPNPVVNELKVSQEGLNFVEIIDFAGKVVLKQSSASNSLTMNLSSLKAGIYMVRTNGLAGSCQKFVKK